MLKLGWQEKWTLRYAVVALLFLALAGFEGIMMRSQLISPTSLAGMEAAMASLRGGSQSGPAELFYSVITVHPIVGIYGFAYMAVFGAFYFLVPFLLNKPVRHKRLVPINFWLQIGGVLVCWGAGFFALFNATYTLYWPLPVAYDRVPLIGSVIFGLGLALIEANVLLFVFNVFSTVLSKSNPHPYSFRQFLASAFGIPRLLKLFGRKPANGGEVNYNDLPVFVVAVGRGSIDTVINAIVLLAAGVLMLVYGLPALVQGIMLSPGAVDALIYKNFFWWGLDMIADGNVLMYAAGTWYLLVPLLVGRKLYGESVVRTVILADLLVSMGVWSHHLLADQPQPFGLRLISGQFITCGEFFTMGLTMFAILMTIWLARPVKFTPPLKFVLGSVFGFAVGGIAGITQANVGLNVVLHNTQWVIGTHGHMMLLGGLASLLFAVIYALIPMLTKAEIWSQKLVSVHLGLWLPGAVIMADSMGLAGIEGMLRRTLYSGGEYQLHMIVAILGGLIMAAGFLVFLVNVIRTLGLKNVLGLVVPEQWLSPRPALATGIIPAARLPKPAAVSVTVIRNTPK